MRAGGDDWSFERKLAILTEANMIMQMENLRAIRRWLRLKGGTLQIHGWMYDIGSGKIRQFDP